MKVAGLSMALFATALVFVPQSVYATDYGYDHKDKYDFIARVKHVFKFDKDKKYDDHKDDYRDDKDKKDDKKYVYTNYRDYREYKYDKKDYNNYRDDKDKKYAYYKDKDVTRIIIIIKVDIKDFDHFKQKHPGYDHDARYWCDNYGKWWDGSDWQYVRWDDANLRTVQLDSSNWYNMLWTMLTSNYSYMGQ